MKLKKLVIDNFLSIGHVELDLSNHNNSIFLVQGINLSDSNPSNGSGKSTLFESIIYGMYGVSHRSEVKNKFSDGDLLIVIECSHNDSEYIIKRTLKGLSIIKDGDEITKNTTKTVAQQIINSEFCDKDNFLRIFRINTSDTLFSYLSTTNRRESLRKIFNIDQYTNQYTVIIDKLLYNLNTKNTKLTDIMNQQKGSISFANDSMTKLKAKIESSTSKTPEDDEFIKTMKSELDKLKVSIDNLSNDLSTNRSTLDKLIQDKNSRLLRVNTANSRISELSKQVESLELGECYACHQKLHEINEEEMTRIRSELGLLNESVSSLLSEVNQLDDYISQYNTAVSQQSKEYSDLSKKYLEDSSKLSILMSKSDTTQEDIDQLKRLMIQVDEMSVVRQEIELALLDLSNLIQIVNYLKRSQSLLINNILTKNIEMINDLMRSSSQGILDDIPRIVLGDKSVDVFVGDYKKVEDLSSGERRRVDILIALVLRDYYISSSQFSIDMLVLDEILDTIDDISNLVNSIIDNLDSNLFIVSHNKSHNISYDYILRMIKENNITKMESENLNG